MIKMGQGNAAAKFCENVLKDMILKNIEDQLSCTELLHDLRVHCGQVFRDIKSLQASIMVDLYRQNKPSEYINYINSYELVVKRKLRKESEAYFLRGNRFNNLAQIKLDQIISIICESVEKTCSIHSSKKHVVEVFFSNVKNLKISHNEASAFLEIDVPDRRQFGAIVYEQLQSQVRYAVIEIIKFWSVVRKLKEKSLTDFLFKEIVGCVSTCPFCKVPCDTHSGGKRSGNHSATLHRPKGLGGISYNISRKLVANDCCSDIASNQHFFSPETNYKGKPYKNYYKYYPTWTIHGNAEPDVEKYWKWVFAQHNKEFAEYYSLEEAFIPHSWAKYGSDDIAKDIEDHYHIKVNL